MSGSLESSGNRRRSGFEIDLMRKGGLRALFAPGVGFKDFREGRFAKSLLIVEDDYDLRNQLVRAFNGTVFDVYAAPSLDQAQGLIDFYQNMGYALVDDCFPRIRGGNPEPLADELSYKLALKFPEIRIFAYAEHPEQLARAYRDIFDKSLCVREVWEALIKDSEGY